MEICEYRQKNIKMLSYRALTNEKQFTERKMIVVFQNGQFPLFIIIALGVNRWTANVKMCALMTFFKVELKDISRKKI